MAKAPLIMEIKVKFRWWIWIYLKGIECMIRLTKLEPDWEKVEKTIEDGMILEVKNTKETNTIFPFVAMFLIQFIAGALLAYTFGIINFG